MTHQQSTFDELYRRMRVTSRSRYNAADRLKLQHRCAQWVVALLSVGLVLLPLIQALNVPLRTSPQLLDAIEVFLAVLILTYSLLLGNENYMGRAEKMLQCGMEVGRLANDLYPFLGARYDYTRYSAFSKRYHDILARYDNHDDIDYKWYTLSVRKKYYPGDIAVIRAWISIHFWYLFGFSHYAVVSAGVLITLFYVFHFIG